jgi:glutamate 5-kinase
VAIGDPDSSWRIWLTDRLQHAGGLVVSADAAKRLGTEKSEICRDDIISVQGDFNKGDVLHVYDESGEELARGMSNFSSAETLLLARNLDRKVRELLGFEATPRIISAENMAILQDHHLPWDPPTGELTEVG